MFYFASIFSKICLHYFQSAEEYSNHYWYRHSIWWLNEICMKAPIFRFLVTPLTFWEYPLNLRSIFILLFFIDLSSYRWYLLHIGNSIWGLKTSTIRHIVTVGKKLGFWWRDGNIQKTYISRVHLNRPCYSPKGVFLSICW